MAGKKYLDIHEQIDRLSVDMFEGSITGVIGMLESIIEQHPNHSNIYISYDYNHDSSYSGSWTVYGARSETDKERDKRLADKRKARELKKAQKEAKEQKERKEYERLKAKYEGA